MTQRQVNFVDETVRRDREFRELECSEDKVMDWKPSEPGLSYWDCVSGYRPDLLDATYNLTPMGIVWSLATDVVQYVRDQVGTYCHIWMGLCLLDTLKPSFHLAHQTYPEWANPRAFVPKLTQAGSLLEIAGLFNDSRG